MSINDGCIVRSVAPGPLYHAVYGCGWTTLNEYCCRNSITGSRVEAPPPPCRTAIPSTFSERSGRSRISQTGGGTNLQGGGANLLFGQFFSENCMKIKNLEPEGGGRVPGAPLRSANEMANS